MGGTKDAHKLPSKVTANQRFVAALLTMSFDLQVTPSTLEVDYDKNLTELYRAITDQDWKRATEVCKAKPVQAATWVVRHYQEDDAKEKEIMWRFLPIHSACARQPPASFVSALIHSYPGGARCVETNEAGG